MYTHLSPSIRIPRAAYRCLVSPMSCFSSVRVPDTKYGYNIIMICECLLTIYLCLCVCVCVCVCLCMCLVGRVLALFQGASLSIVKRRVIQGTRCNEHSSLLHAEFSTRCSKRRGGKLLRSKSHKAYSVKTSKS